VAACERQAARGGGGREGFVSEMISVASVRAPATLRDDRSPNALPSPAASAPVGMFEDQQRGSSAIARTQVGANPASPHQAPRSAVRATAPRCRRLAPAGRLAPRLRLTGSMSSVIGIARFCSSVAASSSTGARG
jgi:hypothetical protein